MTARKSFLHRKQMAEFLVETFVNFPFLFCNISKCLAECKTISRYDIPGLVFPVMIYFVKKLITDTRIKVCIYARRAFRLQKNLSVTLESKKVKKKRPIKVRSWRALRTKIPKRFAKYRLLHTKKVKQMES